MMGAPQYEQHQAVVNICGAYLDGSIETTAATKPLFEALCEALKKTDSFGYALLKKWATKASRPVENHLHPSGRLEEQ